MTRRAVALFVGRRLAALVALLLVVSFVVFTLLYLAPGSTEQVLIGTRQPTPELVAQLRAKHNLDDPFLQQYWTWLSGAIQFDFGDSIRTGRAVTDSIAASLEITVFLGVYAFLLALVAGVPLGVLAAVRRGSSTDRGVVGIAVLGVSTPAFVSGVVLLYVFAVALGWFPTFGAGEGFADRLWHLTLPAVAMAFLAVALIVKLTRAAMITVLEQDYIAFARARGVPTMRVLVRHALRNALVPIVTAAGLVLTAVLTGAVLVETTFALPGLGKLLVESVDYKDVPMLQGVVMVVATTTVVITLLVDLLYMAIDPRIRFEKAGA